MLTIPVGPQGVFLNCGAFSAVNVTSFNCTLVDPSGIHFFVPAGQRLVIDQIDGLFDTPSGQVVPEAILQFAEAGGRPGHAVPLTPQGGTAGITFFAFNQPVRWVTDPKTDFTFSAQTSDSTGSTSCFINLSGHLISFP